MWLEGDGRAYMYSIAVMVLHWEGKVPVKWFELTPLKTCMSQSACQLVRPLICWPVMCFVIMQCSVPLLCLLPDLESHWMGLALQWSWQVATSKTSTRALAASVD
jgi:hypothetical protein